MTLRCHSFALPMALALTGCAGLAPLPAASPAAAAQVQASTLAPAWQAALPLGNTASDLSRWWSRFDDPLLGSLVDAAQVASPTVAAAASRIEQARTARVAAGAALLPTLDASASASRGRTDLSVPTATAIGVGLQIGRAHV